jgi:hypothetical protein
MVHNMIVNYVLSWEEFLETHQESLPKPHIISFVCTFFVAIAVGVFGGLLTYFIQPQDRLVASMFCWLSLVLFLAAFWDLKVRTRLRRKRVLRELHSVYDRFHSSEQTFAFDQEKWTHGTKAGKHEALWSGLLQGVERQNVITLSMKDYHVMVPKRAFGENSTSTTAGHDDAQTLETLRHIVLGQNGNAWPLRLSFIDYALTEVPSLWRQHPFLMAEAHAAGLWFFLMIAYYMYYSTGPGVIWGWMLAGLFLFLTISTQFWYFLIKYRTESARLRVSWESEFSGQGVRSKSSVLELFSAWALFRKFRETRRCFLLYGNSATYHIYPKRCLTSDQQEVLRQLLRAKVSTE